MEMPWGNLKGQDPTAEWEEDIEQVADEMVDFVENEGPRVLNRPIGSVVIPSEQQTRDWQIRHEDNDYWTELYQGYVDRGYSPIDASLELLKFDDKMQERGE